MEKTKQRNHCLQAMKGIACMLVVFTHVLFPGKFGYVVYTIAMATVPVFFMISGYFAYGDTREQILEKLPGKIKNIGSLTISACLLYFLFGMGIVWLEHQSLNLFWKEFHWKNLITFIVLNNTSFIHGGHLWFLLALVYCYAILWIVEKLKITHWCYWFIPVALFGRVLISFTGNWHHTQNFLFYGMPYFFFGYLLRDKASAVKKIGNGTLVVFVIIALLYSEVGNWYSPLPVNIYEIGTILGSIGLFLFALQNGEIGKNSILERIGSTYSLFVYVVHVIVMELFALIDKAHYNRLPAWYGWAKPVAVLGVTMGIAVLYMQVKVFLKRKDENR